jgi:hypothetical protein
MSFTSSLVSLRAGTSCSSELCVWLKATSNAFSTVTLMIAMLARQESARYADFSVPSSSKPR